MELIKDRVYNSEERGNEERQSALYTLYTTLLEILKLFAPIMPHITEEIFHNYFSEKLGIDSIHNTEWNEKIEQNENAEKIGDLAIEIIFAVRKYKSEKQISLGKEVSKVIIELKEVEGKKQTLKGVKKDLKAVTKAQEMIFEKVDKPNFENDKFKLKVEE